MDFAKGCNFFYYIRDLIAALIRHYNCAKTILTQASIIIVVLIITDAVTIFADSRHCP